MNLSVDGANFIKEREGFKLQSYQDGAGIWTIGYGHTGKNIKKGILINKKQADDFFSKDIAVFKTALNKLLKYPVSQNMFDAMLSMMYNIGIGNFTNSTLLRELNKNKGIATSDMERYFLLFNKITVNGTKVVSPGLTTRRKLEYMIFSEGNYNAKISVIDG